MRIKEFDSSWGSKSKGNATQITLNFNVRLNKLDAQFPFKTQNPINEAFPFPRNTIGPHQSTLISRRDSGLAHLFCNVRVNNRT